MINEESLRTVGSSTFGTRFLRPIYDTYGFARLPGTSTQLLTGLSEKDCLPAPAWGGELRKFSKVVIILLDAFGWIFLDQALKSGKYPFLERLAERGVISKLSTQFPSTTTVHVTTMKFGQPVGQHGLYEWNIYEPSLDQVIIPIQFARSGEAAESLRSSVQDPSPIYPAGLTYYQQLAARGVRSYVFESTLFTKSTYNSRTNLGATCLPFRTLPEGLVNLGHALSKAEGPGYFYFYYDGIDSICHKYGPESEQVAGEIDATLTTLERVLAPLLQDQHDLALLLTADHGHASIDPAKTIYLNQELPRIADWLKRDREGNLLKFAGSSRDAFLHIKPEFLEEAADRLRQLLAGKAEVHSTAKLMDAGLFGSVISKRLLARLADLAILCYEDESVWWYEKDISEVRNRGSHGSLTRNEAETSLGFQTFD